MVGTGLDSFGDMRRLLEDAHAAGKRTLELLDQAGAPARIGAHIDNGLSELETLLASFEKRA